MTVKELGSVLSTVHQVQSIPHPNPAVNKESNSDVPGFEDVQDDHTETSNASCSHGRKDYPQDDELEEQIVQGTPALDFHPNLNDEDEVSRGKKDCNCHSIVRTKAVSFS